MTDFIRRRSFAIMQTRHIQAIFAGLTLSVLITACGGSPATVQDAPSFTLVATGNVNNEVGPCG